VLLGWPCPEVVQVIIVEAAAPADHAVVAAAAAVAVAVVEVDVAVVVDPECSLPGTDGCIEGMDT